MRVLVSIMPAAIGLAGFVALLAIVAGVDVFLFDSAVLEAVTS